MNSILNQQPEINAVLQPNDAFVVDRGFRDCAKNLQALKYIVQMPKFTDSKSPRAQLKTNQANSSRLVTKSRRVVESRNGHLKSIWSIFGRVWRTRALLHLKDDIRIPAALINKYYGILETVKNNAVHVAEQMVEKANVASPLHTLVREDAFQKIKKTLPAVDMQNFIFPILREQDLKEISLGVHQLRNARHYAVDHMRAGTTSNYNCFFCPFLPKID